MREQRNFPIEIVQKELQNCLNQAAQRLEQFHQEIPEVALLTEGEQWLHQVQGSLQMLNLTGVVALLQEMEELFRAIAENRVLENTSAVDLLSNAILFIPRYLEYVQAKQKEVSVLLLPTINAIRRMRKVSILPEHSFVAFQIPEGKNALTALLSASTKSAEVDPHLADRISRIRHMYQVGLIGVIRNTAVPTHLKYMQRAVDRLLQGSGNRPFAEFWILISAILDAIGDGGLQLDNSVKQVLGLADRQIRKLKEAGVALLDSAIDSDVRDAMLYYLAKSVSEHPSVERLQQHYELTGLVANENYLEQERKLLEAPDRVVMAKVAGEIQKSLDYIKDRIDFLTGEGNLEDATYEEVLRFMQQVVVTLQVLDLKHASKEIEDAANLFKTVYLEFREACEKAGATISIYEMPDHRIREKVVEIASAVLGVEVAVQAYAKGERRERQMSALGAAYNDARRAVLRESRSVVDLVKQSVGAYIDPYSERRLDPAVLEDVPLLLQKIRGVFRILQKDRVVRLLEILDGFLRDSLLQGSLKNKDFSEDALADVISSLEFYLEAFEQYQQADDGLLDVASEAFQELGCERI